MGSIATAPKITNSVISFDPYRVWILQICRSLNMQFRITVSFGWRLLEYQSRYKRAAALKLS